MIKILLVEDDAYKRSAIAEVVLSIPNVTEDNLDISTDAADAKRRLKEKGYNLLLLDINLPKRADKQPEPGGGLEVLRWLKSRGKQHCPPYVVGTTAFEDSLQLAQSEFNNLIWTVIAFKFSDNEWRDKLVVTIGIILDQVVPPYANDGVTYRSDVLIVTALESPELSAVLSLPLKWTEAKVRFDDARYHRVTHEDDIRAFDAVCVAASDKGMSSAAIATTKAIQAFRPRYVVMVGICAGVRGRVDIGDVVIADPSWDWGSGKTKAKNDGEQFFHPAQYQMRLDESLRGLVSEMKVDVRLSAAGEKTQGTGGPGNVPEIQIGAFASGAAVLQSKVAVNQIMQHHKDLKAVDMEVFSVMYACHIASHPRPMCIAAKSVCDFGDDQKSDDYQQYAADISARFLDELLTRMFRKESGN